MWAMSFNDRRHEIVSIAMLLLLPLFFARCISLELAWNAIVAFADTNTLQIVTNAIDQLNRHNRINCGGNPRRPNAWQPITAVQCTRMPFSIPIRLALLPLRWRNITKSAACFVSVYRRIAFGISQIWCCILLLPFEFESEYTQKPKTSWNNMAKNEGATEWERYLWMAREGRWYHIVINFLNNIFQNNSLFLLAYDFWDEKQFCL